MPKKITPHQRATYRRLRNAGYSQVEAAQKAKFSRSYARKLEAQGLDVATESNPKGVRLSGVQAKSEMELEEALRPKTLDALSDVARRGLDDFEFFRYHFLGSVSTPWQIEAAHQVIEELDHEDSRYGVINSPQGGGKTRLFSHDIPAWLTVRYRTYGDVFRGILGSKGLAMSKSLTGALRDTLERTSPALASPKWKARGMEVDAAACLAAEYGRFKPSMPGIPWQRELFSVERHWIGDDPETAQYAGAATQKEPSWAAFSYEAKFLGWRVDFMNWDDVHTEGEVADENAMQKIFRWWDIEAESRLDPGGLCLVTMQRLGANDLSRYLLDKIDPDFEIDEGDDPDPDATPKQYFHIVYKAHYDDRCQGLHSKDAPPYPEGCMLDPRRITQSLIRTKKTAGIYEIVYQQEDVNPATTLVQKPWVNGGTDSEGVEREGCWDQDRVIGQLPPIPPGAFTVRYMTVDPSPTKWWGIHDWIYVLPHDVEPMAGYRYLVNTMKAKLPANEFLDFSRAQDGYVGVAEAWVQASKKTGLPITYLIMEKNAAQRWVFQHEYFTQWAQTRGVNVLQHETTSNKTDPELGVWATIPSVYRFGRCRLPGGDVDSRRRASALVQEVTTYPNGATDDQLMSQWFGEYNLQHIVATRKAGAKVHKDMPKWMRER